MNPFVNRIVNYGTKAADQFEANPLNYRTHPQRQRDAVQASLRELGWIGVVVENKTTGRLIDGHERVWQALKQNEDVPYIEVELSEEEEKLALAVFDPITYMAETDSQVLDALLREVNTGESALQALLAELAQEAGLYQDEQNGTGDAGAQIDKAAELQAKWQTATGQLWQLGDHRLICGDCTDKDVVARVMDGEKASLLFTDPPYGVDVAGGTHDPRDEKNYRSGGIVENDALSDDELEALLRASFSLAKVNMVAGAAYYIWHPSSKVELFARCVRLHLAIHREIVIWSKENFVFGRQDYHWQHEPAFYGWVDGGHKWVGDRTQGTVWEVEKVGTDLEKKMHPTAKPVGLAAKALANNTNKGDVVYEPFSGSGTTIIACEQLGRKCRAVEISPAYVAVALQRFLDSSGKTPVLVS